MNNPDQSTQDPNKLSWAVQARIIKEFREIRQTTLFSDGGYVDWAKGWLSTNGFLFVERRIESCTVLKIKEETTK